MGNINIDFINNYGRDVIKLMRFPSNVTFKMNKTFPNIVAYTAHFKVPSEVEIVGRLFRQHPKLDKRYHYTDIATSVRELVESVKSFRSATISRTEVYNVKALDKVMLLGAVCKRFKRIFDENPNEINRAVANGCNSYLASFIRDSSIQSLKKEHYMMCMALSEELSYHCGTINPSDEDISLEPEIESPTTCEPPQRNYARVKFASSSDLDTPSGMFKYPSVSNLEATVVYDHEPRRWTIDRSQTPSFETHV